MIFLLNCFYTNMYASYLHIICVTLKKKNNFIFVKRMFLLSRISASKESMVQVCRC